MVRDKYIVFVQRMHDTHRLDLVYGPFYSWNKANEKIGKLYLQFSDNDYWIGVRLLIPASDLD